VTLYEIDERIRACVSDDGEIIDVPGLDALQMARDAKLENLAVWYKEAAALAEALRAEEAALAARRRAHENRAESLKAYLTLALAGQRLETARVKIGWRESVSVDIYDPSKIPPEYVREKTEYAPAKAEIKEALEAGREIPGAALLYKNNIQIR